MRLVRKVAKTLDKEGTGKLLEHVRRAYKQSDETYKSLLKYRELVSAGNATDRRNIGVRSQPDWLRINLQHAYVRSILPTIFHHNPTVKTQPIHPDYAESNKVWQDLLAAYMERSGWQEETGDCALDTAVYSETWQFFTYAKTADDEEIETGEAELPKDSEAQAMERSEIGRVGPQTWHDFNLPIAYRVSPLQVATDCPFRTLKDSRFVVVRFKKHISELVKDRRYELSSDFKERLKNNRGSSVSDNTPWMDMDPENPFGNSYENHDDDLVTVYEVWVYQLAELDLYRQVVYLIDGYDEKPAREILHWSEFVGPYVTGFPIVRHVANKIPDFRGINQFDTWINLNRGIDTLMSRAFSMSKNQKRIYNFDPSKVVNADKVRKELKDGKVMTVVVEQSASLLQGENPPLTAIPESPIPGDIYNGIQFLSNFVTQISGIGQNQRGTAGVRTATEADIINQFSQVRIDYDVSGFENFMKKSIEIIVKMIRHSVPEDLVFGVTGDTGNIRWQKFTAFDAAWSPDVLIEPQSSRKIPQAQEQAQNLQALQIGLQAAPLMGGGVRIDELMRRVFRSLGIRDVDEIVPGSQLDSRIKQMYEIVSMMAGQEAPVLPTDDHQAELVQLQDFMASQTFQGLPLQVQTQLAIHQMAHQEALEQLQANAPKASAVGQGLGDFVDSGASQGASGTSAAELALSGDTPRQSTAAIGGAY